MLQIVSGPREPFLTLAVLVVDEFEEEEVEDNDEEGDGHPENGGKAPKVVAVFVQGDDVVLVSRSFLDLLHMDRVLQLLHVALVRSDVQHRGDWGRQFDGELVQCFAQLHGRVQTAGVASVIRPVVAIQSHPQRSLVVLPDHHRNVEVRVVAVVDASEEEVAVKVAGVRGHLQVLVVEVEWAQAEDHGLDDALCTWNAKQVGE